MSVRQSMMQHPTHTQLHAIPDKLLMELTLVSGTGTRHESPAVSRNALEVIQRGTEASR